MKKAFHSGVLAATLMQAASVFANPDAKAASVDLFGEYLKIGNAIPLVACMKGGYLATNVGSVLADKQSFEHYGDSQLRQNFGVDHILFLNEAWENAVNSLSGEGFDPETDQFRQRQHDIFKQASLAYKMKTGIGIIFQSEKIEIRSDPACPR